MCGFHWVIEFLDRLPYKVAENKGRLDKYNVNVDMIQVGRIQTGDPIRRMLSGKNISK